MKEAASSKKQMDDQQKHYWGEFYSAKTHVLEPSPFAKWAVGHMRNNADLTRRPSINVLDCGCGNGRDTYFFAKQLGSAVGADASFAAEDKDSARFLRTDFVTATKDGFDVIYSRFSYHSITDEMQKQFWESLPSGSWLYLETRSSVDVLSRREHGDDHFRNLTDLGHLMKMANQYGERVLLRMGRGMAKYKKEDPMVLRLACRVI